MLLKSTYPLTTIILLSCSFLKAESDQGQSEYSHYTQTASKAVKDKFFCLQRITPCLADIIINKLKFGASIKDHKYIGKRFLISGKICKIVPISPNEKDIVFESDWLCLSIVIKCTSNIQISRVVLCYIKSSEDFKKKFTRGDVINLTGELHFDAQNQDIIFKNCHIVND
ncbi:MAG: hypothetical protein GY750_09715 [Lentisphaerae bacterium]|nr:hypothetical protein [Lentisphaerota bacterium]MCP4101687.1 hypothetical protein [Lentisphaerota bacterium]